MANNEAQWALVISHYNKWYHVARVIEADGKWWELRWHPRPIQGASREKVRAEAKHLGLEVMRGYFRDAPPPRVGSELIYITPRRA